MPLVTLTFDNGPHLDNTPRVLDTLAHRGVRACFFVVGREFATSGARAIAERAHAETHLIGNHSMTHATPLGEDKREDAVSLEIAATEKLIGPLACTPPMFRPFGGGGKIGPHLLSRAAADHLIANRYSCILWNCVPEDWIAPDAWCERAVRDVASRDHTVVVVHDYVGAAMKHLDRFIGAALDSGARFTQEFPADCVPIAGGCVTGDLSAIVAP